MKVAIITLPRVGNALGGEDQVGSYLARAFEGMGWQATVYLEHESAMATMERFDLVLSNGAITSVQSSPAVYWHFNERITCGQYHYLHSLGYTHVCSNQTLFNNNDLRSIESCGMKYCYLPLAAEQSMFGSNTVDEPLYDVAYVGNWNLYKGRSVEDWLLPLTKFKLAVFGGDNWKLHPKLAPYYQGILPKEHWPALSSIAKVWIAFRSPEQVRMGMTPDRLFWLVASGTKRVVSDTPVSDELKPWINWTILSQMPSLIETANDLNTHGQDDIKNRHLYSHRVSDIVEWVGKSGA